jgi:membrane-associated phospholipid phosphatase
MIGGSPPYGQVVLSPAEASVPVPAPRTRRSPIYVELGWLIFLVWIYDWLQDFAPLRRNQAFSNAQALFSFEKVIGLDPERALDHWLAHQQVLSYLASNFYAIAIFVVTFGFAAWAWWRRPDLYVPLRNDIVLANLLGFAVFWAFPVAPPRMLPGFIDVVAKAGGLGWHNTLVRHADQLAAMPSMHMGYAVWSALVAWRLARSRRSRVAALVFGAGYTVLTAIAVMATGNHYLLDVLAGLAVTALSVLLVEVVPRRLRRHLRRWPALA